MWLGIAALICGVAAPCCCYLTWFPALPLAGAAIWFGAQGRDAPDTASATSANAALVAGGVALGFSILFLLVFVVYVLYMFVVFAAIGSGGNW